MDHFEMYTSGGQWRWRYVAANNRIIAVSSESYWNRGDCEESIRIMKRRGPNAPVYDTSGAAAKLVTV